MQRKRPHTESQWWLARAEQARRIAAALPKADADVAEAYARECEARAMEVFAEPLAA